MTEIDRLLEWLDSPLFEGEGAPPEHAEIASLIRRLERERDEASDKLQRQANVYERPNEGWVCYHCGERFMTPGSARLHFGTLPNTETACRLVGANYDLIKRLRAAEDEVQSLFKSKTAAEDKLAQLTEKTT